MIFWLSRPGGSACRGARGSLRAARPEEEELEWDLERKPPGRETGVFGGKKGHPTSMVNFKAPFLGKGLPANKEARRLTGVPGDARTCPDMHGSNTRI